MDNSPEDIEVNAPEGVHKGDVESELIDLANHLDRLGLIKEADYLDALLNKTARPVGPAAAAE
jgi:hypothetical protein